MSRAAPHFEFKIKFTHRSLVASLRAAQASDSTETRPNIQIHASCSVASGAAVPAAESGWTPKALRSPKSRSSIGSRNGSAHCNSVSCELSGYTLGESIQSKMLTKVEQVQSGNRQTVRRRGIRPQCIRSRLDSWLTTHRYQPWSSGSATRDVLEEWSLRAVW